ncbi:MAG: creatininase family protein [Asgard group archaeon]|nr:creatininase family protein [Asgard group archaeon]
MKTIKTQEMNWVDIQEAIKTGYKSIIIAVGSIEQHGPHLPTITDTLIGDVIAHEIALKMGKTLQGPTISIGCSDHHLSFPGTISLKKETLKSIIIDYTNSLIRHGFKNIIYFPSHGGNFEIVAEAISILQNENPEINIFGYTDFYGFIDIIHKCSIESGKTAEESGAHAGENETSLILAIREDLVNKRRYSPGFTGLFGEKEGEIVISKGMKALTENGILGDPRRASIKNGRTYLSKIVDHLSEQFKEKLA